MKNNFAIKRTVHKLVKTKQKSGRMAVQSIKKVTGKELLLLKSWFNGTI
jgi:hypothetical protein